MAGIADLLSRAGVGLLVLEGVLVVVMGMIGRGSARAVRARVVLGGILVLVVVLVAVGLVGLVVLGVGG